MLSTILNYTRIKEYVFPAVLISLTAFKLTHAQLSWKLPVIFLANLTMIGFMFLINDIEDAKDDALDERMRKRNLVASGRLTLKKARSFALTTCAISLFLFYVCGYNPLIFGVLQALIGFFYSWRPCRLKSIFLFDIIAHSIAGGVLQFLAAVTAFSDRIIPWWPFIFFIFILSAHSVIYNQLRDFHVDRKAGIRNTTSIIGEKNGRYMMYVSVLLVMLSLFFLFFAGLFPPSVIVFFILCSPIILLLKTQQDTRGDRAKFFYWETSLFFLFTTYKYGCVLDNNIGYAYIKRKEHYVF